MRDTVVVALLVVAFAWLATAHVTIVYGLARARPRWRALAALVVLPLAPYFAWREKMRTRAVLWAIGAVAYVTARLFAST